MSENRKCPGCGVDVGELHHWGCDVERCPKCGGQVQSCGCVYDSCEEWNAKWEPRRPKWTGLWPGSAECKEFGWYAKLIEGRGWVSCEENDPDARLDLNRLDTDADWDSDAGRFVLRQG